MISNVQRLLLATVLLASLTGAQPVQSRAATCSAASGKAIYFITNNKQNAVVALPIAADGTLSKGTVTGTGGQGGNTIDGSTNSSAGPDALASQASLTVAGQFLFAVNAGSNTLSMMAISAHDPTHLTPLGRSVALPGEFPTTVAASAKNNLVCVGTTGAKAGISCAPFSAQGLGEMDSLRPFDIDQTTPPVGPVKTVSQTFFSEDESQLFTTVKGDGTANNTGFFSVFPVEQSCHAGASLSTTDVRSSPNGTFVLFGSALIPGTSNVFVTDAAFGGAILSVNNKTNGAKLVAKQAISGQKATCWAAFSSTRNSVFVTDVAVNRIIEMSATNAKILQTTDFSNGDPGLIDLRASGDFVYGLSPGNGTTSAAITVMNAALGKQVQHFELGSFGANKNAQGLALLD